MKPILDRMTRDIVGSLSGSEMDFFGREFEFFNEVTSISGKLKPYIKRPKPEKKVCKMNRVKRTLLICYCRQRSMKKWPR
jgi:hypothetical protein